MSDTLRNVLRAAIPIGVVVGALGMGGAIRAMAGKTDATTPPPVPVSVQVVTVNASDRPAVVHGTGLVQPGAQVDLVAQVSGRVVEQAEGLTPGYRVAKGGLIARVDPRDYTNQLAVAEATLAQARLDLALEEARGDQAAREWEASGHQGTNPLALRQAHLEVARAKLASAEAGVSNARLALERTRLVAPFDAVVISESIDIGQTVGPGAAIARLAGTERAKIRVALPMSDLADIDVPGLNAEVGSPALVRQDLGGGKYLEIEGSVVRALGELDAETRTATVLVAVDQPYERTVGGLPILPGAFVEVTLQGKAQAQVWEVPREAVVEGRAVWVASPDDTLQRKEIDVAWSGPETVHVRGGLADGDRVIVTPLSLPVVGMPLTVRADASTAAN